MPRTKLNPLTSRPLSEADLPWLQARWPTHHPGADLRGWFALQRGARLVGAHRGQRQQPSLWLADRLLLEHRARDWPALLDLHALQAASHGLWPAVQIDTPGYHDLPERWAARLSPQAYLQQVRHGGIDDVMLTPALERGLRLRRWELVEGPEVVLRCLLSEHGHPLG